MNYNNKNLTPPIKPEKFKYKEVRRLKVDLFNLKLCILFPIISLCSYGLCRLLMNCGVNSGILGFIFLPLIGLGFFSIVFIFLIFSIEKETIQVNKSKKLLQKEQQRYDKELKEYQVYCDSYFKSINNNTEESKKAEVPIITKEEPQKRLQKHLDRVDRVSKIHYQIERQKLEEEERKLKEEDVRKKIENLKKQEEEKQEKESKEFELFWKLIESDKPYYETITKSIAKDDSQPFYVYQHIQSLSRDYQVWNELGNGVNILTTQQQLSQYIFSYGRMHRAKLNQAFATLIPKHFNHIGSTANIIDYGCGQGLGTVALIDFLNASGTACDYTKTILIEPSIVALKRAATHVVVSLDTLTFKANTYQQVFPISKKISEIAETDLQTWDDAIKFHIFSNILDIDEFNLNTLYNKIIKTQKGTNYFICVSPNFYSDGSSIRNQRLRDFMALFNAVPISHRFSNIGTWTRYEIVFMVNLGTVKDNKNLNSHNNLNEDYLDDLPF